MSSVADLRSVGLRHGCAECRLRHSCLPAGTVGGDLWRLDVIVRPRGPTERGDRLFRTGDVLSSIFVARDGGFKTVTVSENGEEQVLGLHLPGDVVGLDAVGLGNHRCEAVALASTNVCEIRFEDLMRVSADYDPGGWGPASAAAVVTGEHGWHDPTVAEGMTRAVEDGVVFLLGPPRAAATESRPAPTPTPQGQP